MVEVGQDVLAAADHGLSQRLDLLQAVRDSVTQGIDEPLHQELSKAAWTAAWRSSANKASRRSA